MRLSVVAVVLSTAVSAPALAGTVITSEVSAPNVAGNSVVYYIEPDRVRMEYPGHIVIFRADQDTEYMLAPAEKKFSRMTPETMKQSAAGIAKMFELLKSMPPEQRAQVEKRMPPEQRAQFERIMTPERLAQAEKMMAGQAPKSDYRKAGGTASVGKWRCERVEVAKDGQPHAALCVADISDLGLTEEDLGGVAARRSLHGANGGRERRSHGGSPGNKEGSRICGLPGPRGNPSRGDADDDRNS